MKTALRLAVLRFLEWTQRDISIGHHWIPGKKIVLNSYLHKGYWYYGRKRESHTMELFARLIKPGDSVIEVGGHIGYISAYFSKLVGPSGKVIVFEPGQNNLPYTRKNVSGIDNIRLVEKGVGKSNGTLTLYEEQLTGQNNSFVKNFNGLSVNSKSAFKQPQTKERAVEIVTIDSFIDDQKVDFIKIDVEGFELPVLEGAVKCLKNYPSIMVEVQADREEIFNLLNGSGYNLFSEDGTKITTASALRSNIFCVHQKRKELSNALNKLSV